MPDGEKVGCHLIGNAQTGWGDAAITGDRIVTMTLWAHDVPVPGEFGMYPEQARLLAAELVKRADEADEGGK